MSEHPFAQYIATLGRGPSRYKHLTMAEAEAAMTMILNQQVEPEQLGAFLMLLRRNVETDEEIAGFIRACQKQLTEPPAEVRIDLDWSSYSGKKRQLPYFILAALALAESGINILMHGAEDHTPGRLYSSTVLNMLGIETSSSLTAAARTIQTRGFAYIKVGAISDVLHQLLSYKRLLGLRSPVHTFGRMINPFRAPYSIQGIFHPNYMPIHQGAAWHVEQPHMAVFRGEGGEVEVRPTKPFEVLTVHDGIKASEQWDRTFSETRYAIDEVMNPGLLLDIWRGDLRHEYGEAAIIGTIAVILKLMKRANDQSHAYELAGVIWRDRLAQRRISITPG